MEKITISYKSRVMVDAGWRFDAGWRNVCVTAIAVKISTGMAVVTEVTEVTDIDGNGNSGYAFRTGAKRQNYNVSVACREIGKRKRISACQVL